MFAYDWYDTEWFVFISIIYVIHNAANILPAIAIKNNTMKKIVKSFFCYIIINIIFSQKRFFA